MCLPSGVRWYVVVYCFACIVSSSRRVEILPRVRCAGRVSSFSRCDCACRSCKLRIAHKLA